MDEPGKMNGAATSGDGISEHKSIKGDSASLNPVGEKKTESIVIDLGSLTEMDLIIPANNDYEVTEGSNFNSKNVESKTKDQFEDEEMQNVATEMVDNVIDGANEQISAEKSDVNEADEAETDSTQQDMPSDEIPQDEATKDLEDSTFAHGGVDQLHGNSQMSSFVNITGAPESLLAEAVTQETDANSNTVTKSEPLGVDQETNQIREPLQAVEAKDTQTHVIVSDRIDTDDSKQSWEVISDSLLDGTQATSLGSSMLNVSVEASGNQPAPDRQMESATAIEDKVCVEASGTSQTQSNDDEQTMRAKTQKIADQPSSTSQADQDNIQHVSESIPQILTTVGSEEQSKETNPPVGSDKLPDNFMKDGTNDEQILKPDVSTQEVNKEQNTEETQTQSPQSETMQEGSTKQTVLTEHEDLTQEVNKEQTNETMQLTNQQSESALQKSENSAENQLLEGSSAEQTALDSESFTEHKSSEHSTLEGSMEQNQTESGDLIKSRQAIDQDQSTLDGNKEDKSEQGQVTANDWVDILGNGLLRKKVLREGEGITTRPVREKEIMIKYAAKIKDSDEVVDFNENFSLVMGDQESLDLFDIVCALMQKGETSLIISDTKYAYGEAGKPPKIPPNATMEFEIELLEINDGPYSAEYDLEKRLTWADRKRHHGNELFSTHKYLEATMAYMKASKALEKGWLNEKSKEAQSRINELRLRCYNNLTVAHMKSLKWSDALKSCRAAEKLDHENVKTLYRKGKILCELGELESGIRSLKKALSKEPDNKTISSELTKQSKKLEKQTEKHQRMCQKMFGNVTTKKSDIEPPAKNSWFSGNWGRLIGGTLAVGVLLVGLYAAQKM